MRRSSDGSKEQEARREFDIVPSPPPKYPHITIFDARGLPTYFPYSHRTMQFMKGFCPHGPLWEDLYSAQANVPPCISYAARKRGTGCPSKQEIECSVYTMRRIGGKVESVVKHLFDNAPPEGKKIADF